MLQFITHNNSRFDEIEGARMALEGGCRWIQLRMKDASDDDIIKVGSILAPLCRQYDATLILDDKVQLVHKIECDGVHLGKNDMPVKEARRILGPDKIIGATANTLEDMIYAVDSGADYIGLGPFRFTTTKQRLSPVLGLEGYRNIMSGFRNHSNCPVVAIGGITVEDIQQLMRTGINGIAVSGTILGAENPVEETRIILETINNKRI